MDPDGTPEPVGAGSFDELAARLNSLRGWNGVSYRELHRRVVRARRAAGNPDLPVFNTVYRCLQPGRRRMDVDLVADIVRALAADEAVVARWRQVCQVIAGLTADSSWVTVAGELPADSTEFVGRHAELAAITGGGERSPVVVVDGMAGVGKTSLAVRAAHRLAHRDGAEVRLWADLRGYDADRAPADPLAVLDEFLRRLGVPGKEIHRLGPDGRQATYRRLLADRRPVVVLDNAADADQVCPLLPDRPGGIVLITSRRRLTGLAGARLVHLDALPETESLDMLRRLVGEAKVAEDTEAAARIAELVGHLPLALTVVAGRIRNRRDWTLRDHAARLAERRDSLRVEDELENAIGLSYADLPADAALLLRLLAIHPGRDVDTRAAAALAGVDLPKAEALLGELVAGSLVQRSVQDRFGLHDVVRLYAAGLARDVDAASARRAALGRLFGYYRHAACRAMDRYAPHECDRRPVVSTSDVPAPDFADVAAATAWLDAERHNLVGITVLTEEQGGHEDAATMSPILNRYLYNALHFADAEIVHGIAVRAADPLVQASAYLSLGAVYLRSNRYQESIDRLKQALARYEAGGDRASWARALNNLGNAFDRLSDFAAAEDCYRQALLVHRETGNRTSESRALGNLGNSAMRVGDWDKAEAYLDEALAIMLEVGDRVGECLTYGNLGTVHEQQGHSAEALGHYRRALATAREFGYPFPETEALLHIGSLLARLGEHDDALTHLTEALDLARRNSLGEFEIKALNGIGIALGDLGDAAGSITRHREALAVAEKLGDRYEQARAHKGIGHGAAVAGDTGMADEHGRKAQALLTEIGLR
ncbi:tetratricopeptide repeat protein [Amycolatopsis roodepoortensis]|uniref:Tetratricopeptide (TPR) repeat protein n=1 Tax=Amycolatopsis roodepoortensis TaxID=700274 RepID=A0ABR9KZZ6_9PSEU|nr:tetratricopeptide repeat protein [Amycolatopsis roodepoortensis]MBE1573507.1 tetratricopeptide (TPR) repeat protein [Amycolatopsis roodepoortensis]